MADSSPGKAVKRIAHKIERQRNKPKTPERATAGGGLLAQIEQCRREVAGWPEHMRVVAVLRIHPAAMDGA